MLHSKLTKGVKRDPSLPKGRQTDDLSEKEIKELVGDLHFDRSQLIEALHLIVFIPALDDTEQSRSGD